MVMLGGVGVLNREVHKRQHDVQFFLSSLKELVSFVLAVCPVWMYNLKARSKYERSRYDADVLV